MPDREQRLAEAERAVRRGELKMALATLRAVLTESPEDAPLRARIATIESVLQPHELAAESAPAAPVVERSRPATLEQTAEMLFDRGDLGGAIATYERVLKERPGHELARERFLELQKLHAVHPGAPPPASLPRSRPELLEALLARIATRRKP